MRVYKYVMVSGLLFSLHAMGQSASDALNLSQEHFYGTARYKSMSGAFGALGGDISAMALNPAGSAVFSNSEMAFSFGSNKQEKTTSLLNKNTQTDSDFSFNQFGLALTIPNSDSLWKKFAIGFGYNRNKNFNLGSYAYANRGNNGIDNYLLNTITHGNNGAAFPLGAFAGGNYDVATEQDRITDFYFSLPSYDARDSYLGIMSEIIVPQNPTANNVDYVANTNNAVRTQEYEVITQGKSNKYTFNFAAQYADNLYLGANINTYSLDTYAFYSLKETGFDAVSNISYANHQMRLNTTGSGISFQLGGLLKATENVRLGVSYTSPTWYSIEEEFHQMLFSEVQTASGTLPLDIELVDYRGNDVIELREYKFRTPSSWMGSVAYVFGKKGLISLDYIYKGYGNTYFSTDYLKPENDVIQSLLGDTSSVRIGGEYRIGAASLRAGYRFEQSPYRDKSFMSDLNGFSVGAGYAFGGMRLDISYDWANQDFSHQMYQGISTPAKVQTKRSNLLFTLSAKLF